MFPSADTSPCLPLPSSGFRGRPFREPCGSPPSPVLWAHKTARPSFPLASGFPWPTVPPMVRRGWGALLGSWEIPVESCPELETPATPAALALSVVRVLPSAKSTASASQRYKISELNLHGLFPRCVRFVPTSHPVNSNTRYRPACYALAGRDLHPLDFIRKFHLTHLGSSFSKLYQAR
jgi:hypothetical protein